MKKHLFFVPMLLLITSQVIGQDSTDRKPEAAAQPSDEANSFEIPEAEKPFWDSAQAFLDAYAKRDAQAIGKLFTEDAEFYDEFGERTEGRENIVNMYQEVFDSSSEAVLEQITIERVRRISDKVALEEGVVVARDKADGPTFESRYVALHTLGDDGKWRINTLKSDARQSTQRQEQLQQLAWLTGSWVNQDSDSVVHTECDWSDDGNYLLRRFTIQTYDGREMSGVQRIGWDPAHKKLRSWTFDSQGGFFNGLWTQKGDQWLVTSAGITSDGTAVTGTAVYSLVDAEMIRWQYTNLIVGDDVRDDMEPVTMVKHPPEPRQQAAK